MKQPHPLASQDDSSLAEHTLNRCLSLLAHFSAPVLVETAEAEGDLFFLHVRTQAGTPADAIVTCDELEAALAAVKDERALAVPAADFFLFIESARIRLAYAFDPHFAVSLSGVEPLPHQLEVVYEQMLPQARLRFLLADDPGAGKTIMAGLLIKELKMGAAIDRLLVAWKRAVEENLFVR